MVNKITDIELRGIIQSEIDNAQGYMGGALSAGRKKSLEYYMGEKLGTEIDGRSQVVSTDVADTVETILPNLLRIFTASDRVVKCEPVRPEDKPLSVQATNYINYIFNKDNNGFSILYTWFKDALLEKNGIVKVYWDDSEKVEQETYENLNQQEYDLLINDDNVEVVEKESFKDEKMIEEIALARELASQQGQVLPDIPTPMLYNCVIKRTSNGGKVKIENIPPEEFLIQRTAKSIDEASFVAHKVTKTRSELIEMGYDRAIVDDLPTTNNILLNDERLTRYSDIDETPYNDAPDESTQEIEIFECYVRADMDGDGVAELRKVIVAGEGGYTILENMVCDSIPFCSLTPIPMPHRFYGRSVAELVEDVQLVKSTVMRQLLDNMYLTNNNRVAVMDGMVNLDDLLTSRPGGVVRTKQPPNQVMMPMQSQSLSQQAFPLLEYLDTVRESRTGVTRYNQGLDADSLNKTATGVNALMTQSQMRMELVARVFAETGIKDLFRKIFELTCKYQDKERIVELNNQFIPVKPTEWRNRFNISITVGLGTGTNDQQIMMMNNILERQIQAFQLQGGKEYPMVSLKNIYNSLSKIIENAGLKNVDNYFVDPDQGKQMMPPPQPPELTPIEKIEFTRIASEEKRKLAELELELKKIKSDNAMDILNFETKIKDMELKYQTQLDSQKIKADADINKLILGGEVKSLMDAEKSTKNLQQEIEGLNGQDAGRQTSPRSEPIAKG
nr:portal protein [uncultured Mediterranean phage uvMED]BAR19082.1 portal protein [uncultured Mediterranean phage uvMED]